MGLFDSLFGLGAGIGTSYLSGLMNTGFSKELQEHQGAVNYKYAEKTARNNPTWNRAGLESAGYNPMLAVQNATAGANAGWTSGNTVTGSNVAGDAGTMISNAQATQRLANETEQTQSISDLNYANADKAKVEKASLVERLPYISKQAKADYVKTEMESAKLENDIHYQNEYLNYLEKQMEVNARLQEMGIHANYNASIYGANKAYNASTYSANLNAETQRGTIETRLPFGLGGSRKYYQSDDIFRKPNRGYGSVKDINDKKYWHYY